MLISPQPTPMCRHNLTSSTPGRREIPWNQTYLVALWQNTKPVSNIWSLLWISIQHADLGFSKRRKTWHFSALLNLHGSCTARFPETWLATHGALLSPWDLLQPSDLHAAYQTGVASSKCNHLSPLQRRALPNILNLPTNLRLGTALNRNKKKNHIPTTTTNHHQLRTQVV